MAAPPEGTVTFLFTDIVGSTRLWEQFPGLTGAAVARHDAVVRAAIEGRRGHVFKTVGDAFCAAFSVVQDALNAAVDAQRALAAEEWGDIGTLAVRMGLHTGAVEQRDNDYFGPTLNRTARIEAAAHGGQILLSQVTFELLQDDPASGVTFQSLGDHRLRNLERPEHLFQAVSEGLAKDFPPPKSMEVLPNNLPVQATSFIGREREMDTICQLLEKTRLLTLTGTGGTGKTRLSLEAGARLINHFRDGVWLVELALLSEPTHLLQLLFSTLGVREDPERSPKETLLHFLRSRHVLLILDNCEHLLAPVASLAAELLRACPHLKILATSRHSLSIAGETTLPVPPLAMWDIRLQKLTGPNVAERLSQFDAVRLFIERAVAVRPDFAVTNENAPALAEICSRLDGIPLAIELAAARVRVLDLDQIAARLENRFRLLRGSGRSGLPHQQTLEALIDWSHDLLSDKERILFRRLGTFVGGRSLEALEAVCSGDDLDEFEILDLLQQLVDKSLVSVERDNRGVSRYTLIESVWQYARQRLEESGEAPVLRQRHLDHYLAWAKDVSPRLEGRDQREWLDRVQSELFNLRFAMEFAIESGNAAAGFRLTTSLYRAIEIRGDLAEAREAVEKLFLLPLDGVDPLLLAEARIAAGRLCWAQDLYPEARTHYAAAQVLLPPDHPKYGLADMLTAFLDRGDGQVDEAERRFNRGLAIGRQSRDSYLEAGCITGLGSVALDRGNLSEARQLKEESLEIYVRLGDHWIIGLIQWGIVRVALAQNDQARAEKALKEWTKIARELRNRWILPYIIECRADLALVAGKPEDAALWFAAAEAARENAGIQFSASEQAEHDASLARLRTELDLEILRTQWEAGRQLSAWEALD